MRGTVKWFNAQKGYGFITSDDGTEIFVYHSQIQMEGFRKLDEGDIVSFEVGETENKRVQAVNVEPILTVGMVEKALAEEGLHLSYMKDQYGNRVWLVSDENNFLQSDERGMYLDELAAYAGFSVSEE